LAVSQASPIGLWCSLDNRALQVVAHAATQDATNPATATAAAPHKTVGDAVAALQAAVRSGAADHDLVKAAEAVTAACAASAAPLTAASGGAALEALALAASVAGAPVFRGALILERGRLLGRLSRPGSAVAAVDAALPLLRRQPLPAAGQPASRNPTVVGVQRWVVGRMLRAARLLHGLGQEQAAQEVLAPLPAAAAALLDPSAYASAMGQLSSLTGESWLAACKHMRQLCMLTACKHGALRLAPQPADPASCASLFSCASASATCR
jgi:hypothetical protein